MANAQKYTRGQIGGLTRHYERAIKQDGSYYDFGNQEINIGRTHLNYNLGPERDGGQLSFIDKRISEVQCLKRSDVNVMCSWVITTPKDLADDEYTLFFQQAYSFLNQRYAGGSDKNVISAYVHMDETMPHLHYAFVPVVHDKKKGIDKVSAKIAIDRLDLQTFHNDLEQHMARVFGQEVGILNEATKDGNKSIKELKRGTAQEELTKIQGHMKNERAELIDVMTELTAEAAELSSLRAEKKKLTTETAQLEKEVAPLRDLKKLRTSTQEVVLPEPTGIGKNKTVKLAPEDAETLKEQANSYIVNRAEIIDVRQRRIAVSKREKDVTTKEKATEKREALLGKREAAADALYARQSDINNILEQAEKERDDLKKILDREIGKNGDLESQGLKYANQLQNLTERLRTAYTVLTSAIKAIGMLKYDDGDYKIQNLSKKQAHLIDGIANYGAKWAGDEGYKDLADDINKNIGISDGINKHIKTLERNKKRGGHEL